MLALAIAMAGMVQDAAAPNAAAPAQAIFYRTGGLKGALRGCEIFEDKKPVAHVSPNSAVTVDTTVGRHFYRLRDRTSAVILNLEPGKPSYVRCAMIGLIARPLLTVSDQAEYDEVAARLKPRRAP